MRPDRPLARFVADASAVIRSDERMILLFLLLLSVVALAVFLYHTTLILDGLPDVVTSEPPRP